MMLDDLGRRLRWLAWIVLAIVAGLAAWWATGCGVNEAIVTGADRIMAPLSTERFWFDAAHGILRAWVEAFPVGSAGQQNSGASVDPIWLGLTWLIYPWVYRPIRLFVSGWLRRRREAAAKP